MAVVADPRQTYTELDTVPWSTLVAGDVVNIYYRPAPYVCKVGIGAVGTAINRIYINGVTDSNGNRPIISGAGARTASGSMIAGNEVFGGSAYQQLGVITIVKKAQEFAQRPCFITIQNIEVRGANAGVTSYDNLGVAYPWDNFGCGFWFNPSTDIDVINCVATDNCLGLFSNSMAGGMEYNCERFRILYNRFYGNGVTGDDHQHNVYHQCYDSLFEGNYIGYLRPGSIGSAYKSRCGKEVVRYNWIEGGGNLLDMVQADGYFDGMVLLSNYDTSWVYGNVMITDEHLGDASYRLVHFGGDNQGEQNYTGTLGTSPTNYRKKLYFWNNTVVSIGTTGAQQYLFKLSYPEQVCEFWNNIVYQPGAKSLHLMHYSGTLNIRGTNIIYSPNGLDDWAPEANGSFMTVTRFTAPTIADPLFVNPLAYDLTLGTGSPALNAYSSLPAGIPTDIPTTFPLENEPTYRANGTWPKTLVGNLDLGALEFVPGAPPRSPPAVAIAPVVTASATTTNTLMSSTQGSWLFSPTSYAYQWQLSTDSGVTWNNVSGANSNTHTALVEGRYRCVVTATNVVNSTPGYSNVFAISNVQPASIVRSASGTVGPTGTVSYTFASGPAVGNTVAAFFSGVDTVSDTYGNVWTKVVTVPPNDYNPTISDTLWTTVVTATGNNFIVSGVSTGATAAAQSLIVYEINGLLDTTASVVGAWAATSVDITTTVVNSLVLAVNRNGVVYADTPYPPLNAPMIFDLSATSTDAVARPAGYHAIANSPGAFTITQGDPGIAAMTTLVAASFKPKP